MSFNLRLREWNHKRIDKLRALKLRLARGLFAPFSALTTDSPSGAILVLRLDDKIGDAVTATGFLRELKKNFPDRPLIVAVGQSTEPLYRSLDFINKVVVSKKGMAGTLKTFFALSGTEFGFIINTSHILTPRVVFLCSFIPAFKKIGFGEAGRGLFTDQVPLDKNSHVTARYGRVLDLLGARGYSLNYEVRPGTEARSQAARYVDSIRKKFRSVVVLNSFAGARLRNFSEETTKKIVSGLLQNPEVAVISIANEGDQRILFRWVESSYGERWQRNGSFSSLEFNLALVELADVVITPDTAWVHLAAALKKKIVAIYREETNPDELNAVTWAPYGTRYTVLTAPSTSENPHDINNVDATSVSEAALKMLNEESL